MYPGIELRLFRYAIAVAQELHFGRAALRVHVSQPTLSNQVRELEDDLGVKLFDRTNRQVRLTRAGTIFVREAGTVLQDSERAIRLTKEAGLPENGAVSVGYTPRINLRILSIVRGLGAPRLSGVKLAFVSSHTHDQVQALLDGAIQVGLITLPLRNEYLVVKSLVREPMAVALPESHLLAAKDNLEGRELNSLPMITMSRRLHPSFHDHLAKVFKRIGYRPSVVQEVLTEAEALYMVAEGLGITFLKKSSIPVQYQGIAFRRLLDPMLVEETGIAHRRDNRSNILQSFVGLVRSRVQGTDKTGLNFNGDQEDQLPDNRQLKLF